MDLEEVDLSMCESELSAAYDGDVSLVESSASIEISVSESETDVEGKINQGVSPDTSHSHYSTCRSLLRGVRKPQSSAAGRSDLRKQVVYARMQAELIRANSKIVQLESELSHQRNLTEHAQIQQTDSHVSSIADTSNGAQVERLHQLEQERCDLLEELHSVRDKLSLAEKELKQKSDHLKQLSTNYDKQTKSLNEQISELKLKNELSQRNCEKLTIDMTIMQTRRAQLEQAEAEELQYAHERSLEVLRSRIEELETVESELVRSETQVKELERRLRTFKHSEEFLRSQQNQVFKCDELERQVKHLQEENVALKRQQDNEDLLRYKVQTLQEKCAKFEGLEAKVAQLELENQQLMDTVREKGNGEMALEGGTGMDVNSVVGVREGGRSQAVLWYKIAELQQKEVLLTAKQGELMTGLSLAQLEATEAKTLLEEVRTKLMKELSDSHSKDEHIRRLEKRLTFVTKERDGCINVLKSYKLDSGVDALLRENMNELEQQLVRANERIAELEEELQTS